MDEMPSDSTDMPEITETPEIEDTSVDYNDNEVTEIPEVPEITDDSDVSGYDGGLDDGNEPVIDDPAIDDSDNPETPEDDDLSFHTRPGGYETLSNPESEPIISPHTPEVPYGGGNPERGW